MQTRRILWIESRRKPVPDLVQVVRQAGYEVHMVASGRAALAWAEQQEAGLVVIYAASFGSTGVRISRRLYQATAWPQILIVVQDREKPRLRHARVLRLPVRPQILLRYIADVFPSQNEEGNWHVIGPLAYDLQNLRIRNGDRVATVTQRTMDLFLFFLQHPNQVLSREEIFEKVWGMPSNNDLRTLDVHICWLRRALGENARSPRFLKTVRGRGYRFDLPENEGP